MRALLPVALLLIVAACGGDDEPTGEQEGPPPVTVDLSSSATSIQAGQSVTLTWTSANATGCTASNGWTGSKATSGSETRGPLQASATFALECTGAGSPATDSVTVTVAGAPPPPAAPTLTLSASPASISAGGTSQLTWSTTNATACTASGAWSGTRATSGSASVGPLNATGNFTLACTGSGGSVSRTATVTVTGSSGPGVGGSVDSSLVNRSGENRVYVFAGTATPDDFDGDAGDPVAEATAAQDENACTFSYRLSGLAAGTYTLAFTGDAANDRRGADDTLRFVGATTVNFTGASLTHDFRAARVVRVGPGRQLTTVRAAASAAQDGDVIEVDAGVYSADVTAWFADNVTVRGVGGYAHLRADGANSQGKGTWVVAGNNMTVENIEFSGSTVPDQNGAGIRHDGSGLTICNGYFHDNENGILGGGGTVLIEHSEFANNGFGDGQSHNMYIAGASRFILRYSYSHHARIGHNVKTRAPENHILYNRIMDEATGTASYAIDVPDAGLTYIIGNLIQQGPNTDNSAIVAYGAESGSNPSKQLFVINNTFVNERSGGEFLTVRTGTTGVLQNNLFVGGGTLPGLLQRITNLSTNSPGFVWQNQYDYRIGAGSPAIDAGSDPAAGPGGIDLRPAYEYVHKSGRRARNASGALDVGAYEFTP